MKRRSDSSPHADTRAGSWWRLSMVALLVVVVAVLGLSFSTSRTASSSHTTSYQPQLPITAAFFYPWYPSHWTENGSFPYTNFTPELGLYSSMDDAAISEQLSMAEQAHLDAFISSWWERDETTDLTLQHILSVTEQVGSDVRWAVYYEREGYSDPDWLQIAWDLQYLSEKAFDFPAYLRVGGKPVVFVYGQGNEACSMVDRWLQARQLGGVDVYVVLKVFEGYTDCSSQPDAWHEYNPTLRFSHALPDSVSVSPGFWKAGEQSVLPRDAERFEISVQWMALSQASWQLITTWNEWAEGTGIEPTEQFGRIYVDILCRNLPGSAPCSSSPPTTPQPPPPTATPVPEPSPDVGAIPSPTPAGTPQPTLIATPTPFSLVHGDLDCDSVIEPIDALLLLRQVAYQSTPSASACPAIGSIVQGEIIGDVDCNGVLEPTDGLTILRFVVGLPVVQSGPCPAIGSTMA